MNPEQFIPGLDLEMMYLDMYCGLSRRNSVKRPRGDSECTVIIIRR